MQEISDRTEGVSTEMPPTIELGDEEPKGLEALHGRTYYPFGMPRRWVDPDALFNYAWDQFRVVEELLYRAATAGEKFNIVIANLSIHPEEKEANYEMGQQYRVFVEAMVRILKRMPNFESPFIPARMALDAAIDEQAFYERMLRQEPGDPTFTHCLAGAREKLAATMAATEEAHANEKEKGSIDVLLLSELLEAPDTQRLYTRVGALIMREFFDEAFALVPQNELSRRQRDKAFEKMPEHAQERARVLMRYTVWEVVVILSGGLKLGHKGESPYNELAMKVRDRLRDQGVHCPRPSFACVVPENATRRVPYAAFPIERSAEGMGFSHRPTPVAEKFTDQLESGWTMDQIFEHLEMMGTSAIDLVALREEVDSPSDGAHMGGIKDAVLLAFYEECFQFLEETDDIEDGLKEKLRARIQRHLTRNLLHSGLVYDIETCFYLKWAGHGASLQPNKRAALPIEAVSHAFIPGPEDPDTLIKQRCRARLGWSLESTMQGFMGKHLPLKVEDDKTLERCETRLLARRSPLPHFCYGNERLHSRTVLLARWRVLDKLFTLINEGGYDFHLGEATICFSRRTPSHSGLAGIDRELLQPFLDSYLLSEELKSSLALLVGQNAPAVTGSAP